MKDSTWTNLMKISYLGFENVDDLRRFQKFCRAISHFDARRLSRRFFDGRGVARVPWGSASSQLGWR